MLKELRNQHRNIIQMVFAGFKNKEIAERLEMSDCTVSQIIRSPLGQAYLEGLQDKAKEATLDVRKKLVSLNKDALTVLERVMNPKEKAPHSVQLTAAKDVLDRTGYKAPDKLHVDMTMQTKTDQEIDAEINAMQQSIEKTYLQSPGTPEPLDETVEASPNKAFTDEPIVEQQDIATQQDMDSSGKTTLSSNRSEQPALASICNNEQLKNSPDESPEESIVLNELLADKLPADIFQPAK